MYKFYLPEKANCLEAAVFCVNIFLTSFYYFNIFSCNRIAVKLDPTAALV